VISVSTAFWGTTLHTRDAGCLLVSENAYEAGSALPRHAHKKAFFSLTLAGGYVERHGARDVQYAPRSISFHPPGEEHSVAIGSADARCVNIEVREEWLTEVTRSGGGEPPFVRAVGGPLVWLAERLLEETGSWSSASSLSAQALVAEMLGLIGRERHEASDRLPPRWLEDAEEILRREFTSSLTLQELASRVGVHPVHLSRTWHRFRRCSIGETLRRWRIADARRRLATGTAPLADIALAVGFADQAHFSRAFKQVTGVTPRRYRDGASRDR